MQNLLLTHAIDVFEPIAKWLVIGVLASIIVVGAILFFAKKKVFPKYAKIALISVFAFLLALGLSLLIMEICKKYSVSYLEDKYLDARAVTNYVLIPVCCFIGLIAISATVLGVVIKKYRKPISDTPVCVENAENATVSVETSTTETATATAQDTATTPAKKSPVRLTATILGVVNLLALIACGVLIALYYDMKFKNDGYYNSEYASVNQLVLYIGAGILIISLIALAFILDRDKRRIDTKCLSMAGICIAMSFGLSYIKLFEMPQGGSITLVSLLPIMIFSYAYGTKKGLLACFIYGILQAVQDPFIIHPAQFLLDYPVAFASIGLSGTFAKIKRLDKVPQVKFILGGILASAVRFLSHVLSGVFAFSAYAEGANPWIYSLAYNSFVFVDIALVLVIGAIVFSSKTFNKALAKSANLD